MGRRRTDCSSGAEESWRVGKEQETQEGEPPGAFPPEHPKLSILSRWTHQSLTKHLQHSPQTLRSRRATRPDHRMSRHQVPSSPVIV